MRTAPEVQTAALPARRPPPRWPFRLFRAIVVVQALLVFSQALYAGRFLAGDGAALGLHELTGTEVITVVALAQLVASVLVWRPGRGPWLLIGVSAALFAAISLQIGYGFAGALAIHVPLGVAILVTLVIVALTTPRAPIRPQDWGPQRELRRRATILSTDRGAR